MRTHLKYRKPPRKRAFLIFNDPIHIYYALKEEIAVSRVGKNRPNVWLKLHLSMLFYPILASVSFLGVSWTSVSKYIVQFRQHDMREGGRQPKFLGHFSANLAVLSAVLSNLSFRQLPSASVGFRLHIYCSIQTT